MINYIKILKIEAWQNNDMVHPLTCGHDSNHRKLVPKEIDGRVILKCEDCNYFQTYIPECVLK